MSVVSTIERVAAVQENFRKVCSKNIIVECGIFGL